MNRRTQRAAEHRSQVLALAARRYREHGFDGIGIAELMRQARLTHGGFYAQFESKAALTREACAQVTGQAYQLWAGLCRDEPHPLQAIYRHYLSTPHRREPGAGCLMAALGSELSRQDEGVREVVGDSLRELFDLLAGLMPGEDAGQRQSHAMAAYAAMVGAMICARACPDEAMAEAILAATWQQLPGAS